MALVFLATLYLLSCVLAISQEAIITFTGGELQLASGSSVASLFLSSADSPGVGRAGQDLSSDFGRVTGKSLTVVTKDQTTTDQSHHHSQSLLKAPSESQT
jgi:hypothetical protein